MGTTLKERITEWSNADTKGWKLYAFMQAFYHVGKAYMVNNEWPEEERIIRYFSWQLLYQIWYKLNEGKSESAFARLSAAMLASGEQRIKDSAYEVMSHWSRVRTTRLESYEDIASRVTFLRNLAESLKQPTFTLQLFPEGGWRGESFEEAGFRLLHFYAENTPNASNRKIRQFGEVMSKRGLMDVNQLAMYLAKTGSDKGEIMKEAFEVAFEVASQEPAKT